VETRAKVIEMVKYLAGKDASMMQGHDNLLAILRA
jgi:hypothetical protein